MATETMYDHDTFVMAISNGLNKPVTLPSLSFTLPSPSLTSLSLLPSYTSPPQLPSHPVVYAVVAGGSASEDPPALVPLQVRHSTVKVVAESNPNLTSSVHVKYHTSWFLSQSSSSLILAVPVGFGGSLVSYEFTNHSRHKSAPFQRVELDANYKPHFKNIYLFSFPWVDVLRRSKEIVTVISCVQKFSNIDHEQGLYSFTVPLSLPSYVALRPLKELGSQTLRLILECKGTGTILEHDISSHPFVELITDGRRQILHQESRSYSDKDLICSFKVSTPVVQAKLYHEEASFIRSLEQGLKLTSGHEQVSFSPESFLPIAPVLYAVVSNMNIMNTNTTGANKACQLPALVPLQMMSLSVKINAEPMADSLCVQFNGRWSVQCIKDDHTSPLILAVPVGCGVKTI